MNIYIAKELLAKCRLLTLWGIDTETRALEWVGDTRAWQNLEAEQWKIENDYKLKQI